MEESIDTFFKIDECTAVCNLNNWSCDDLADWVSFSDCVPWILFKLLEAKGYSLLVQVPTKDLSFNNIADVDNFLRVILFVQESSEMCARPSIPGSISMNTPKLAIFVTGLFTTSPI